MTPFKPLIAAALALAASAALATAPVVKLLPTGGRAGDKVTLTVYGEPNGHPLSSVVIRLKIDPSRVTIAGQASWSPGWDAPAVSLLSDGVALSIVSALGQSADGPIASLTVTKKDDGVVPVTVDTAPSASAFSDDQAYPYTFPSGYGTVILPYPVRNLGAAISGSPSAGFDNVAVVAGNALRLLKKDDLSDVNGAAGSPLSAGISGRPSFGAIAGRAVVAVGTTDGNVAVFDAETGAAIGSPVKVGTFASSPAITSDGTIYAAASDGVSASLVNVSSGASARLQGAAVKSDPAILFGCAVAATDAGVTTVRVPGMVPQAFIPAAGAFTSPVLDGWAKGVIASDSRLYDIDCVTGNLTEGPAAPSAFSEGFQAGDSAYFGGADGALYRYAGGALTSTPLLSAAIASQPLVLGGKTYAGDAAGHLKAGPADEIMLGGAATKALAATGAGASDGVIVAMPEGVIAKLPL
ncbi:MAG TPA: hypothetical protein VGM37_12430 [Armatimonadota bacterium]|jgi:hypothetical protein